MQRALLILALAISGEGCITHGGSSVPSVAQVGRTCKLPSVGHSPIQLDGTAMVEICSEVYVEAVTTSVEQQKLRQAYDRGVQRNLDFYGGLQAAGPVTVFCNSDPCRTFFTGPSMRSLTLGRGGRALGATFVGGERPTIVIVYWLGYRAENVLAHEMAHVEFNFRASPGFVPAWFNEGLATLISGDPDCWMVAPHGVSDLRSLDRNRAWIEHTNVPVALIPTYCQARNEVKAWLERNGKERLWAILDEVKRGANFYDLYGEMSALTPDQ